MANCVIEQPGTALTHEIEIGRAAIYLHADCKSNPAEPTVLILP